MRKLQPGAKKSHSILKPDQAIDIFYLSLSTPLDRSKPTAAAVSREYGISEKTVRDIWNGRTWAQETQPLVPHRPLRLTPTPSTQAHLRAGHLVVVTGSRGGASQPRTTGPVAPAPAARKEGVRRYAGRSWAAGWAIGV
jgi:hypothetical protein